MDFNNKICLQTCDESKYLIKEENKTCYSSCENKN